jgi:hypothetical protein
MGVTMSIVAETLTERERQMLEHLKQAQELGSTLTDYAAAVGLNVQELYTGKAQLTRKGVLPAKSTEPTKTKAELLAVQVTTEGAGPDAPVCRILGPCGWSIECHSWPAASWIAALMGAGKVVS